MPRWWLVMGSPKNWETAFDQGNLWGLKESQRDVWEHLEKGDRFLFYASSPIRRLIGFGTVQSKFIQNVPLWPEEIKQNTLIWPLRVELNVEYCFPQGTWQEKGIVSQALLNRARRRQTFQLVEQSLVDELLNAFPEGVTASVISPAQEPIPLNLHEETIRQLLEVGRLQNFIAEKEYDMEGSRLDVVWRRVARAVPNYVFEVHIGGDLHRDLAKLKHAFDIWNSNIFLVSTIEGKTSADKLLSGLFHEIKGRLKFIEVSKVAELLDKKKSAHDLEVELGII